MGPTEGFSLKAIHDEWHNAIHTDQRLRRYALDSHLKGDVVLRLYAHQGALLLGEVRGSTDNGHRPTVSLAHPFLREILEYANLPLLQDALRRWRA